MPSGQRDQTTAVVSGELASTPGEPHFTPGAIIGNRYRIVSLSGEGGMGRVYRADDMKLGHRVALKFLPPQIAADPGAFDRVRAEVRIGRQITHPNICRIHDIVEAEGQHFISMEYVDGEDLASLLHRIGRLPSDKALAIARDLASGVAAAHARGVVHRDLKPANVMIDGDGNARIMDFGLAALSDELEGRREIAGTPPYMAPEQFIGEAVTRKTDIYAVGLILFEMFTGRKVFGGATVSEIRNAHSIGKTRPSSLVKEIDPDVEKVILRCIEEDPNDRPSSVQAILAALPGGDALEKAVALGQTPSPALVAAGGETGDLEVRRAWLLLAALLATMLAAAAISHRWTLPGMVPDIRSRDALRDRVFEIHDLFGLPRAEHSDGWYRTNSAYVRWLSRNDGIRRDILGASPPSAVIFIQRSSPVPLVAGNSVRQITESDPAENVAGMSTLVLDHAGRLRSFRSVPPERIETVDEDFDWSVAFAAAGLDVKAFAPADPLWTPPHGADRRAAWTGTYPNRPDIPIRVEVASRAGRPVFFRVVEPWDEPAPVMSSRPIGSYVFPFVTVISLAAAIVFARRNLARGRGDRRGAWRTALVVGFLILFARFGLASHSQNPIDEWWIFSDILMLSLYRAATIWLLYLAAEPYVRRQWPHMLIASNRLIDGRLRDPLVGRDILIGSFVGSIAAGIAHSKTAVAVMSGSAGVWPLNPLSHASVDTPLGFGWIVFAAPGMAIIATLVILTSLVLFRLVLRSYVAAMAVIAICLSLVFYGGEISAVRIAMDLAAGSLLVAVLHRYGALAFAVAYAYHEVLLRSCLTFDLDAWYSLRGMATLVFLATVAVYGFHTSLAGKPALGKLALDEDAAA